MVKTTKKSSRPSKHYLLLLLFGIVSTLSMLFLINKKISRSWSAKVAYGQLSGKILKSGDNIIYGTSYSRLSFFSDGTPSKNASIDLNNGDVTPQFIYKNSTFATAGETLWKINFKNKKTEWQFSTDDHDYLEKALKQKKYVLASSKSGILYALNYRNGKKIWKFTPKELTSYSSIVSNNKIGFFGEFLPVGNNVLIASRDGFVYLLQLSTGKVVWEQDIGKPSTTKLDKWGKNIFLTTKDGNILAVNSVSGKLLWKKSSESETACKSLAGSFQVSGNPILRFIDKSLASNNLKEKLESPMLIETHTDGTIVKRDAKTGQEIWQSSSYGKNINCLKMDGSLGVVTDKTGKVFQISLASGKTLWQRNGFGPIVHEPVLITNTTPSYLVNNDVRNYIFADLEGKVWSVKRQNGKTNWIFDADAPVQYVPEVFGVNIYLTTADGVIYKLNKNSGKPEITSKEKSFNVAQYFKHIGNNNVFEISLISDGNFNNPWREAKLDATFTSESGEHIEVPGFYYDKNIWKVRFNPPKKGTWTWKVVWSPHGYPLTKEGAFVAKTDTQNSFLRIDEANPERLTTDSKTIFNGIGIGDTVLDYNYTGTPLDDWATGNSAPITVEDAFGTPIKIKSDTPVSLQKYVDTYGPNGAGFNIFRWSLMNASSSLYREFQFPIVYSVHDGKIGDEIAENLKKNNVHIWLTIFGFDVPFKRSPTLGEKYLLTSYIRYVFARYSAYTDIWELANEEVVPETTAEFLVSEIQKLDYEKRPISVSSENPTSSLSDIIAPHWYESELLSKSDSQTVAQIELYKSYKKPIIFSEQGNKNSNFDENSAERMRVRAWTAFFNQASLVFWNQSDSKNFVPFLPSANLYIGKEERSYIKTLQQFTKDFDLNSRMIKFSINNPGIRGYGLMSSKVVAGYFFHYSNPFGLKAFRFSIPNTTQGNVIWTDPETGKEIRTDQCLIQNCYLSSPPFKADISFKFFAQN